MEIIKANNLTKYYGKTRGIVGLNLNVGEGDFFGFIGPNGAGKSTTIRALLGLIKANGGNAEIFGININTDRTKILENVGFMPAEAIFYNSMRVGECIRFSADLRKKDCLTEAKTLCERLSLDTSKKIGELSLGNRKKVSIVCAMQHKPKLYVMDEPTSGLDPLIQREFFDILSERNREGATVFMSSHVLSEVQRNCRRAAIIRCGRIIACDSVEALTRTKAKRVTIHGKADISQLADVRDVKYSDGVVNFLYGGGMPELTRFLAGSDITDLSITEPNLEEIFMHYYTEETDK